MSYTYAAYYHHQFDHHQPQFDHPLHMTSPPATSLAPAVQPLPESQPLNPTAAMLEHILARMARFEARLDEHDRRLSTTRHQLRPEPDPPDGPPLYAAAQPPYTAPVPWTCCWDPPGSRNLPHQQPPYGYHHREFDHYQQPFVAQQRRGTCWEPAGQHAHLGAVTAAGYYPWHDHQPPPQPVLDQQPQLLLDQQPPPGAAAPPPLLRSDPPPKQPSTTSTIELPPYAAPRPCQPLLPLPVTAPLLASTRHPQVGVSSSKKKVWETNLPNGEEKREECNNMEKVDQIELLRAPCFNFVTLKELVTHSPPIGEFSKEDYLEGKELISRKDFFRYSDVEGRKLLLLEQHRDGDGQVTLKDLEIAMASRNLPRRSAKEFLKRTRVRLLSKSFAWNELLSVIAFDPGGDTSPNLLFATLFIVSWFPP